MFDNFNYITATANPSGTPAYDDDGNMANLPLGAAQWTLSWNAENQLAKMEKADAKLEFAYDYLGRRVEKKVYSGSGVSGWTLDKHLKFVYDGFKCIEELDGANSDAVLRKYLWNEERLLAVTDTNASAIYYCFADANKNIGQLIDSSGSIMAQHEYSPFGVEMFTGGSYADNPFRFSSEYFDIETNLVYYNYRYYSPELGRWLSRDPIEEAGGINLYSMLGNDPVNYWDYLGQYCDSCSKTNVDNLMDKIDELIAKGMLGEAIELLKAAGIREEYIAEVSKLAELQKTDPEAAKALRSALKIFFNDPANSTETSRALAGLQKAWDESTGVVKSGNNAAKSNAAVNRAMSVAKIGGTAAVGISLATSGYSVYHAENRARTLTTEGTATLGALGGASAGVKLGAIVGTFFCPGIGTGIGAVSGGIVGGIGGAILGNKVGRSIWDAVWK